MEAKRMRWLALALALGIGLGLLILTLPGGRARAGDPGEEGPSQSLSAQPTTGGEASMLAADSAFDGSLLNISDSSVETTDCYQAGNPQQILCFTVYNASPDAEWLDRVRLTMPLAWSVSCSSQDTTDSMGNPVKLDCSTSFPYEVLYIDNDSEGPPSIGEISAGSSWGFCVNVTVPSGYTGPRLVHWGLSGDEDGALPHEITDGETTVDMCTPLTLVPSQVVITGCNGTAQSLEFELTNYGAGDGTTVNFVYDAPDAEVSVPTDFQMDEGDVMTFTIQFEPKLCLEAGDVVTGMLAVVGGGQADESFITQAIAENDGWRRRADSDIPTMDSVVVWASHRDGGLWSIGGYGSDGAVQRYDPGSDTWRKDFESEAVITPLIQYPMDGCYGLDGPNPETAHEIVVLFPDTIVTDSLHVYDITADNWYTRPIPTFFPPGYIGHWGFDVVSLLNNPTVKPGITDKNMCYLSGGNNEKPGGGTTLNLWRYDPEINDGAYIGNYIGGVWFGFHASWYVPWVGAYGAICVAGGVDHSHQINDTTQCYDLDLGTFNDAGDNLGTLPEPWWGMADGWQATEDGYEIWIANGVAQDGTLLPISAYFREGMSDFAYGPPIAYGMYRLEGDGWDGQFFTLNGSRGGFWSSEFSLHLAPCPTCHEAFAPLVLRDN
ncbi:MAG: hypothetical protein JXA14_14945 [Anaerolineae bacterium]|nr:hypothetical protein [Anaerolineae bacterium]